MVVFTLTDYFIHLNYFPIKSILNDISENYKLEKTHQYHDKIFNEILDNKTEFINFIHTYLPNNEIKLNECDLEKYNRKFITSNFKIKEADIIYKINNKEVFILLEHQSTIDYEMPERIVGYCLEIIRSVRFKNQFKDVYPLIIPIVLYTGNKKWNVPLTISKNQEHFYNFNQLKYPKYNLIDINYLSNADLINDNSAISKAMLFEKIKSTDELFNVINLLSQKNLTEIEIKYINIILKYSSDIMKMKLPSNKIEQFKNLLKGGKNIMSNYEKLLTKMLDDNLQNGQIIGEKRGQIIGEKRGRKLGKEDEKRNIVKQMLKLKMSDELIIQITKIDKAELETLKKSQSK